MFAQAIGARDKDAQPVAKSTVVAAPPPYIDILDSISI